VEWFDEELLESRGYSGADGGPLHVSTDVTLINDQRTHAAHLGQQPRGGAVGQRGVQLVEQHLRVIEAAAVTVETRLAQQSHGQSGFARTRFADEQDVVGPAQEVQPCEGLDLRFGDPWLTVEREGLERPAPRQMRLSEAIGEAAFLTERGFLTEQSIQQLRRGDRLVLGAFDLGRLEALILKQVAGDFFALDAEEDGDA